MVAPPAPTTLHANGLGTSEANLILVVSVDVSTFLAGLTSILEVEDEVVEGMDSVIVTARKALTADLALAERID